jgi:hypothetical protein
MNARLPELAPHAADNRPLVVHLVYSLDVGGLETLLVDCINRMPAYRHAVVCLTSYTAFAERIGRPTSNCMHSASRPAWAWAPTCTSGA